VAADFLTAQNDVYTHLVNVMSPAPVVDTEERDDELDNVGATGTFTPFVGVAWSSPIHTGAGQGIVNYAKDPHLMYFVFRAVAPDKNVRDYLFNKGWQALVGYTPANGTQLKSSQGWAYTVGGNGSIKRYYREQQFSFYTNMGAV
jgi:hypothetical protein